MHGNLEGLQGIRSHLPEAYRLLYSDAGGNDERLTFVFDSNKLVLSDEVAEVAPAPKDYKCITLPGVKGSFNGFDRSPYLAHVHSGNVHGLRSVTAHLVRRPLRHRLPSVRVATASRCDGSRSRA